MDTLIHRASLCYRRWLSHEREIVTSLFHLARKKGCLPARTEGNLPPRSQAIIAMIVATARTLRAKISMREILALRTLRTGEVHVPIS
jgi:hypothetical protein